MARPPLSLVQIIENPHSAREKQVLLTAKGERFLATMVAEGLKFQQQIVEHLTPEQVSSGMHFLQRVTAALGHALPRVLGAMGRDGSEGC